MYRAHGNSLWASSTHKRKYRSSKQPRMPRMNREEVYTVWNKLHLIHSISPFRHFFYLSSFRISGPSPCAVSCHYFDFPQNYLWPNGITMTKQIYISAEEHRAVRVASALQTICSQSHECEVFVSQVCCCQPPINSTEMAHQHRTSSQLLETRHRYWYFTWITFITFCIIDATGCFDWLELQTSSPLN